MTFDWSHIEVFLTVAAEGSLSAAARRLGISQPTAGRRIGELEQQLDCRLFDRESRGYALTEAGARLRPLAERMFDAAADLSRAAGTSSAARLSGNLRIGVGDAGGRFLASKLGELIPAGARVTIEILSGDSYADLSRREVDMAIRNLPPQHGNIIVTRLVTTNSAVYASPAYLDNHPDATNPALWPHLVWAGFDATRAHLPSQVWLKARIGGRPPDYRFNRSINVLAAVKAGHAMAILPCFVGDAEPGLRRIFGPKGVNEGELWLAYHADISANPLLRAVKDRIIALYARSRDMFIGVGHG